MVMVKPALPYLDVIRRVKEATQRARGGLQRERRVRDDRGRRRGRVPRSQRAAILEALTSIRRAGADIVITYHAKEAAEWLRLSEAAAVPKVRSRKDGAAVPLDELDKKLLNLMQGSFPLAPRPYAARGAAGRGRRGRGAAPRAAPDRRAHHPPGHADLRHARARLQLDARGGQGRPREPAPRGARSSTRTPACRTTTCATTTSTCGSRSPPSRTRRSAWRARSSVLTELTGAESVRQLPTLKLFKIRMDLEMEKGTKDLAAAGVAAGPDGARPDRAVASSTSP